MIQRLVTSNPSPRYVTECVNAFRTGKYYGVTYSGEYGDLGATVAAILLDREARSTILDSDHTFGRLREPWYVCSVSMSRFTQYHSLKIRVTSGLSLFIS